MTTHQDTYDLDRTRQQLDKARAVLTHALAAHHAAIAHALTQGTTQAELVTLTGYKREQIRRIARAHGIPPAR